MDDVLVVVVAQASRQLLVVHLGLVLPGAPPASHLGEGDELVEAVWGEIDSFQLLL